MTRLFSYRLVNEPHQDPALLVALDNRGESYLFDLGDVTRLQTRSLLQVSRVFVSHTHIDHFYGFDTLLRVSLGKPEPLHIYGPRGIIANVRGKIAGYTWNLITDYPLELHVHEFTGRRLRHSVFAACDHLRERKLPDSAVSGGVLHDDEQLTVRAAVLDHKIPVLAFALDEKLRINVNKDALEKGGFKPGAWLSRLKQCVAAGEWEMGIDTGNGSYGVRELSDRLLLLADGMRLAYVTDIQYSPANVRRLMALTSRPDVLFCEAFFESSDEMRAFERCHLTAGQARKIADAVQARRLKVFHFSPRYKGNFRTIIKEASAGS